MPALHAVVHIVVFCYTMSEKSIRKGTAHMTKPYTIDQIRDIVSPIAREHGVSSVALFGSYATGKANADSDIDLKIEKGKLRSLYQICALRLALEDALNLPVNLITSESSDKVFLSSIANDEIMIYQEA